MPTIPIDMPDADEYIEQLTAEIERLKKFIEDPNSALITKSDLIFRIKKQQAEIERLKILLNRVAIEAICTESAINVWYGLNSAGQTVPGDIQSALLKLINITDDIFHLPDNRLENTTNKIESD